MNDRKNILFLANRVPFPPDKGDKIRTFHQLDHLALSHNVYCACFAESAKEVGYARALRRWCEDVVVVPWSRHAALVRAMGGWLRGKPLTIGAYNDKNMMAALGRWVAQINIDVVVAFSSSMAPYALRVPAKRRVLDLCDVDSQKWRDYAVAAGFPMSTVCRLEGNRLREFEHACLHRFDAMLVITERERDLLDPEHRCGGFHVVPNGVTRCGSPPEPASRRGLTIGFVGAMNYRPNVEAMCWFVNKVWRRVVRELPFARLLIVGRNPVSRVRRLGRVSGVVVTGEVADVRRHLAQCRVVVAPLHIARGLQNKVLEAMAMRRPVVATSAVAACMHARPDHDILVADDPIAFSEKVLRLCRVDSLCDKIAGAGYRCVVTHYDWSDALRRYEELVTGSPVHSESTWQEQQTDQARAREEAVAPHRWRTAP